MNAFLDDDHPKIIIYVNSIPDISFINTNGDPAGSRVRKVQEFMNLTGFRSIKASGKMARILKKNMALN